MPIFTFEFNNCDAKILYKNDEWHRDGDLPAFVTNESIEWYKNGYCHRDNDLPAIIDIDDRTKIWYKDGVCHRNNNLPAIVSDDSIYKEWFINGIDYYPKIKSSIY